ncbi:MAG: hypothetical protein B7Y55_01155 [Polynucleobacter sp. 35-46-207]|jgi:hypothetical protein|nr:MAG: hypothetical protein B7Y55_01155 [Polynucleobacter sp. 35-46-207]OZB49419.1 MAG: hypothetical protein B7X60_01265 [Polynucleobacter sp. 39-45-136]
MSKFDEVLKRLIDEVTKSGFADSPRMTSMMRELKAAAEESFIAPEKLEKMMGASLHTYFKRATSPRRLKINNSGVERLNITRIMPELRSELDRRILANASLIKLNRAQAIDKTLQRFAGWATSVPANAAKSVDKAEVTRDISKTARDLRYEVRRREIDQGHKLMAAIDATIAHGNGAIAMQWQSHWRQPGYDYREDHKERDGKVYAIRGAWAISDGLINKGAGYTDEITAPAQEISCKCNGIYLYSLNELPDEMLTAKGRAELNGGGMQNAS